LDLCFEKDEKEKTLRSNICDFTVKQKNFNIFFINFNDYEEEEEEAVKKKQQNIRDGKKPSFNCICVVNCGFGKNVFREKNKSGSECELFFSFKTARNQWNNSEEQPIYKRPQKRDRLHFCQISDVKSIVKPTPHVGLCTRIECICEMCLWKKVKFI